MKKIINIVVIIVFFLIVFLILAFIGNLLFNLIVDYSLCGCANLENTSLLTGIEIDCMCIEILGYQFFSDSKIAPILGIIINILLVYLIPLTGSFFLTKNFKRYLSNRK